MPESPSGYCSGIDSDCFVHNTIPQTGTWRRLVLKARVLQNSSLTRPSTPKSFQRLCFSNYRIAVCQLYYTMNSWFKHAFFPPSILYVVLKCAYRMLMLVRLVGDYGLLGVVAVLYPSEFTRPPLIASSLTSSPLTRFQKGEKTERLNVHVSVIYCCFSSEKKSWFQFTYGHYSPQFLYN